MKTNKNLPAWKNKKIQFMATVFKKRMKKYDLRVERIEKIEI